MCFGLQPQWVREFFNFVFTSNFCSVSVLSWDPRPNWKPGPIIAFQGSHSVVVWDHRSRHIARGWLGSAPSQESVLVFPHFKPQALHGQLAFFFFFNLPLFTSRGSLTPPLASRNLAVLCLAWSIWAHYQELCLWQLLLLLDPRPTGPSNPTHRFAFLICFWYTEISILVWGPSMSFCLSFFYFIYYCYVFRTEGVGHSRNSHCHLG